MNRQILSRAFQGWLAYCRRLMAVRTHLTALVNTDIVSAECPSDASIGVTDEIWQKLAPGEKVCEGSCDLTDGRLGSSPARVISVAFSASRGALYCRSIRELTFGIHLLSTQIVAVRPGANGRCRRTL